MTGYRRAKDHILEYIEGAKGAAGVQVLFGGGCDATEGYFIEPTLLQVEDPTYRTMCEEIFGPVMTLYVYPERRWVETLRQVDTTSPYALTGAVFARDRRAVDAGRFATSSAAIREGSRSGSGRA